MNKQPESEIFTIPADLSAPSSEIPSDEVLMQWIEANDRAYYATHAEYAVSTPQSIHEQLVADTISYLRTLEHDHGSHTKIIASRIERTQTRKSMPQLFGSLAEAYPDACIFLFSTPLSGTWIGASPELLLQADASQLTTMSLAGTRLATDTTEYAPAEAWDDKNIAEQRIVTDFLIRTLSDKGLAPCPSPLMSRRAGSVEHLCTIIHAPLSQELSTAQRTGLIHALSPTPALSGYPRREAVDFINAHESAPRRFYGGMVGISTPARLECYVNLRSAQKGSAQGGLTMYAGGGITTLSDPTAEWHETCRKLSTLTKSL